MTDREKVINGLEDSLANNGCGFMDGIGELFAVSGENLQNAIALLKAQEPLNAIKLRNIKTTFRDEIKFEYSCPNCYSYLMKGWKACPVCGRGVKWE